MPDGVIGTNPSPTDEAQSKRPSAWPTRVGKGYGYFGELWEDCDLCAWLMALPYCGDLEVLSKAHFLAAEHLYNVHDGRGPGDA